MKVAICFTAIALSSVMQGTKVVAAPIPGKESVRKEHTLPKDKQDPVITLNLAGGMLGPVINNEPSLTILADGSVKVAAKLKGQKSYEGKLTPSEVQDLLDFAIDGQKFFEFEPKKVEEKQKAIEAGQGGLRVFVSDAQTTTIRIQADGQDKIITQRALGQGPQAQIEEFKRLLAVQERLLKVMVVFQLGGKESVEAYLKQINEKLKADYPKAEPFTLEHIRAGGELGNNRYMSILRQTLDAEGKQTSFVSASLNHPAGGKVDIKVRHSDDGK